ncbi:copper resistance D family protein [Peribacillus deserti]|uniref:Copper resistance protein D domain-containing protein n=1 Tax=Peribacillus deserti TaxID=673318 RepID=A0A2N5MAL6_9BACI|nr:CopD family protein [Peribacillus deserti]PLT31373.1 hypothetical protein CUU66_02590 [Peribacillus deserti]
MNILVPTSEILNYLFFSILAGHIILLFVPESMKPSTRVPKPLLLLSTLGIFVCSLVPVIGAAAYFSEGPDLLPMLLSVITTFTIGKVWLLSGFVATFFWMTLYVEGNKYLQAFWLLLLVGAVGSASHVASLSFKEGFVFHSMHFLTVILWVGILLHVGWFAKDINNWSEFLKWFNLFALTCFLLAAASGFVLMTYIIEPGQYLNSWGIPYGQVLLLKHISAAAVVVFAFLNGVLSRKIIKDPTFNPLPWVRMEGLLLLIVFSLTGVLSTLSPPHETTLTSAVSPWLKWITGDVLSIPLDIQLDLSLSGVLLTVMSIVFIALILVSFLKQDKPILALLFGLGFIGSLYLGLMMNLQL